MDGAGIFRLSSSRLNQRQRNTVRRVQIHTSPGFSSSWVYYVNDTRYRIGTATTITEKTSASDDGKITYTVKYEFTDESGYRAEKNVRTGQTTVAKEAWDSIAVGDIHTVLYLPGKRRWSALYQFGLYQVVPGSR